MADACPHCARHQARPESVTRLTVGAFNANCAQCCARLVRSARPLRHAQEAHLAAVTKGEGRPTRDQVVDAIGQQDAAHRPTPTTKA